jgi:hypothetical protein
MDAAVGGELRVKGGGEQMALTNEDREAVALGEDRDIFADLLDARRADVDGFERAGVEVRAELDRRFFDGTVDLAAIGVALDRGVEDAETGLRRMQDFVREENATGTGTESGGGGDEGAERFEEAVALQELEKGSGFAAGNDEAVEFWELIGFANEHWFSTDVLKGTRVRIVVALDGKDADAWLC